MTSTRNIKMWVCVACLASSLAAPANQIRPISLDIVDMAAISRMTPQQLEKLAEGLAAEEILRTKRSSAQALTAVVSKASSGLQSKVGLLGQASSFIASASSKSNGHDDGYSYEPQHETKVDFWGLKKSILYTLFQAVKAIAGGVTILKGQLIKGGGAVAASLGKVISKKGEVVSNLGKKIVSSAALSEKKPTYGPPPPVSHIEYPPSAYGAPTAPAAHYSHSGPSEATGYAAHKYPSHLDGRGGKLNGLHAGFVILTPVDNGISSDVHGVPEDSGHTPLEPPPSIISSAFSAIKNVFSSAAPSFASPSQAAPSYAPTYPSGYDSSLVYHPPPPPQPMSSYKPMSWGAVNSYGEPAMVETYPEYDPRHPQSLDYASNKLSTAPRAPKHRGLTPDKLHKINENLKKVAALMNENIQQRSSEELPKLNVEGVKEMLKNGRLFLPTPVVSDNEVGVLPAELLPSGHDQSTTTTTMPTTTTTSNTEQPKNTTETENRRKDIKYILRGNRIIQV